MQNVVLGGGEESEIRQCLGRSVLSPYHHSETEGEEVTYAVDLVSLLVGPTETLKPPS